MANAKRIRVFELSDGSRVGHQLSEAEVKTFLAANAGSKLVR